VLELWVWLANLRLKRCRGRQGRGYVDWSECGKNTYNPQAHVEHGALEDVADLVADTWSESFGDEAINLLQDLFLSVTCSVNWDWGTHFV